MFTLPSPPKPVVAHTWRLVVGHAPGPPAVWGGRVHALDVARGPLLALAALRRDRANRPAPIGCDPKLFADQISSYLQHAAQERAAAAADMVSLYPVEAPPSPAASVGNEPSAAAIQEQTAVEPSAFDE